jgi:acyl-CoA thioesterase FadM
MMQSFPPPDERIERIQLFTRGYEVSSRGWVAPAQLLRYVEHIRWRTITRSDSIPVRKFMGLGVVRAQVLELYDDVSFDTELEISMWLARVGTTSIDFGHEIFRVADGACVARSAATIVALGPDRRPAQIDPGARRFLMRRRVPTIERLKGDVPSDAWEHPIQIRPSDEDMQGHVNQARYADYVDDTRALCAAAGGYGEGDFAGPARRFVISYEDESRVGDGLVARTFRAPANADVSAVEFVIVKGSGHITTRAKVELRPPRQGGTR